MIFVSVGTQLPFPRLIAAVEKLAQRHHLEIFAQTADPKFAPSNIAAVPFLTPAEFSNRVAACRCIVGHAGTGTVLQAKQAMKPVILFPRSAALGEHRNDHQAATARAVEGMTGVYVAWSEEELESLMLSDLTATTQEAGIQEAQLVEALGTQLRGWQDEWLLR